MATTDRAAAGTVVCESCESEFQGSEERYGCWILVPGPRAADRRTVWVCAGRGDRPIRDVVADADAGPA